MTALTILDLPEEVHSALARRGAASGRTVEEEARAFLQTLAEPSPEAGIGSRLRVLGERYGGVDLERRRGAELPRAADFE